MNWIETADRLPTENDADERGNVKAWCVDSDNWSWCQWDDVTITHFAAWISLAPYRPPAPEYRPFTRDEFLPHAKRWIEDRNGDYVSVNVICNDGVVLGGEFGTWARLLDRFIFADDKTPCGVLVDG